ncbi:MAG: hypothetical protein L0332_25450 [Chloroflexi bacterium]|nr:hypothetical protein [Chloroflexota bacterium]MCI0730044.1 hypothetical protein [Chloroflexota bacterium]
MLEATSFAIAVITLLVAIAAFVFVDPQGNRGVRYGFAVFFLFLTLIFACVGVFALVGNGVEAREDGSPSMTRLSSTEEPVPQTSISATEPLTELIIVVGNDSDGTIWIASKTGTYSIKFVNGAYNGWRTDADCNETDHSEQGCWKTKILIYQNCEINWILPPWSTEMVEPGDADYFVGDDAWQQTQEDASIVAQSRDPILIELEEGDCLRFIAVDGIDPETSYSAYSDNRGQVELEIKLTSP